jgi:hypothetical protein
MLHMLLRSAAIATLLLSVSACSSSSGGGGGGSDAIAKCNAYVDTFCVKTEECTTQKGNPISKADCISQANTVINCSASKSVTSTYDACISELESLPCSQTNSSGAIDQLPASCNGAILQ